MSVSTETIEGNETSESPKTPEVKEFRYRLDFYYQQAILYLVTLLLYTGIRGTIAWNMMPSLASDPILYIIILFVLISFGTLILNKIRGRKLLVFSEKLIFHQRYHERALPISDIEWMYIGRERFVQTAGKYQVVVIKTNDRRRLFRIRIGRYERGDELLAEIEAIGTRVPRLNRAPLKMKISRLANQRFGKEEE
jgi:hypothetical protein